MDTRERPWIKTRGWKPQRARVFRHNGVYTLLFGHKSKRELLVLEKFRNKLWNRLSFSSFFVIPTIRPGTAAKEKESESWFVATNSELGLTLIPIPFYQNHSRCFLPTVKYLDARLSVSQSVSKISSISDIFWKVRLANRYSWRLLYC